MEEDLESVVPLEYINPLIMPSCLMIYLFVQSIECALVLNENFSNFKDSWEIDIQGETGKIAYQYQEQIGYLSTNVTHCPELSNPCYRAELKIRRAFRSRMFPSNSNELWLGCTFRIPSSWAWNKSTSQITSYMMQIHGGDNLGRSPIFGIRNRGTYIQANICGNDQFSSTSTSCTYYYLGRATFGEWEDWIIHNKFSFDTSDYGFVEIWRNDSLVLNISGILTSYNDTAPHYLKIGTYVLDWKNVPSLYPSNLINWIGVDYKRVVVADRESSFSQMQNWMLAKSYAPTSACNSEFTIHTYKMKNLI